MQQNAGIQIMQDKLKYHGIYRPIRKLLHIVTVFLHSVTRFVANKNQKYIERIHRKYPELRWIDRPDELISKFSSDAIHLDYLRKSEIQANFCPYQPKFSILIPVYKVKVDILRETLISICSQTYKKWEICLVDDASNDPDISALLKVFSDHWGEKIKIKVNKENLHISAASNVCLDMATGEYIGLLDHDDILLPNALAEMVRAINKENKPEILYSDERVIAEDGSFKYGALYKPHWSPFLHLCCNYTTHFSVYSRNLLKEIGGFRKGFEGSQDHDLMLRAVEASKKPVVHVPFVLYLWRATAGSTAVSTKEKPYAAQNGIKVIKEALDRRGRSADVEWEAHTLHYRVKYHLPHTLPKISILIPTRDQMDLVKNCLASIESKSTYTNYEVLVINNDSKSQDAQDFFAAINRGQVGQGKIRTIDVPGPFNFARLNNMAAQAAHGEYLVLLNNDTVVHTPNWLEEMLSLAQWPEIGAVGCKLLYEDGTLQHAGVVLQDRRIAAHALRAMPANTDAYISMANTVHETTAVTAACLMVAKKNFMKVGMLDEVYLPNGFGDIDFCLKLKKMGLVNIYTPYAVLTHLESKSRGRTLEHFEKFTMMERWGYELINDRYVNPNLMGSEYYIPPGEEDANDFNREVLEKYWRETLGDKGSELLR